MVSGVEEITGALVSVEVGTGVSSETTAVSVTVIVDVGDIVIISVSSTGVVAITAFVIVGVDCCESKRREISSKKNIPEMSAIQAMKMPSPNNIGTSGDFFFSF